MQIDLDVLIVGGGPAGSTCAALLAAVGAKTAIVESSDFSQPRIGETVSPDALTLLSKIGIGEADLRAMSEDCRSVVSVWGRDRTPDAKSSLLNPHASAMRVDRRRFDKLLFDRAASAGAVCFSSARVVDAGLEAGRRRCWIEAPGVRCSARAEFIVEATGRNRSSPLVPCRRRLFHDQTIAVVFRATARAMAMPFAEHALVESASSGWWYSVALPGDELLLAFFTDSDLLPVDSVERLRLLSGQLDETVVTGQRVAAAGLSLAAGRARYHDARMSIRRTPSRDGWLAIGDALVALDPLSGRGITEAMQSAGDAAACLLSDAPARRLNAEFAPHSLSRYNSHIVRYYEQYGRESSWRDGRFWRRRRPPTVISPGDVFAPRTRLVL